MTKWQKQLRACFERGKADRAYGLKIKDCPYKNTQSSGAQKKRHSQWVLGWNCNEPKR